MAKKLAPARRGPKRPTANAEHVEKVVDLARRTSAYYAADYYNDNYTTVKVWCRRAGVLTKADE